LNRKSHFPLIEALVLADKSLISYKNVNQKTALHEACLIGDLDVVKFLVTHGSESEVNARDSKRDTPLHIAARHQHFKVVKFLIENKADVNFLTITRYSPLHEAAISGNFESVRLLVENGASITQNNNNDRTPILEANRKGFKRIVHFLEHKIKML
jgi:ankyrin repeat protein